MDYQKRITAVVEMLKRSSKTLVLTGAGISTESGIPDFRSPGTGLWEKFDPIAVSSLSALKRDPALFYSFNLQRWTAYADAVPNAAHLALAKLEQMGLLLGVITQNIDSLHKKAGTVKLWEVHGHLRTCRCLDCTCRDLPITELTERYNRGENPPRCPVCQGVLRPDVVLFEESMNEQFFHATQVLSGCQLLIVIGSSLTVYPVAGLPELARRLVIINNTVTPWDDRAEVVLRESAGQVFTDILTGCQGDGVIDTLA